MKKVFIYAPLAAIMLALLMISAVPGTTTKQKKNKISMEGTWQMVSYKYGSQQSEFTDCPETARRIKVINESHFIWIQYDTTSRTISSSAGGRYTLSGNNYTEHLEYGLAMEYYLRSHPSYTVQISGDILFQSGLLVPGYKIEEIWKRIK